MRYFYKIAHYTISYLFYIPAWIVEGARLLSVWLLNKEMQLKYRKK